MPALEPVLEEDRYLRYQVNKIESEYASRSRCSAGAGALPEPVFCWSLCSAGAGALLEPVFCWSLCSAGAGALPELVLCWSWCSAGAGALLEPVFCWSRCSAELVLLRHAFQTLAVSWKSQDLQEYYD